MLDLDELPFYEIQTMYYLLWKEREEDSKLPKEQQQSKALGRMIENSM